MLDELVDDGWGAIDDGLDRGVDHVYSDLAGGRDGRAGHLVQPGEECRPARGTKLDLSDGGDDARDSMADNGTVVSKSMVRSYFHDRGPLRRCAHLFLRDNLKGLAFDNLANVLGHLDPQCARLLANPFAEFYGGDLTNLRGVMSDRAAMRVTDG